jgi:hypothetical protein
MGELPMIYRLFFVFFVSVLLVGGTLPAAEPAQAKKGAGPVAGALLNFSLTVRPRTYLSLHEGKVYSEQEGGAHQASLDFVYLASREGGYIKRELYNLSGKDTKLPPEVLGTKAGIVALSWSDDLVAKCKTTADLKRMTGSYTANSFSFYAVVTNNRTGDLENKRFIFLDAQGRMGLFTVKQGADDDLVLEGKITP